MRLVAEDLGRTVLELPVGFKYIAAEMLSGEVLIGGEESGGVGFGMHLPERDALFAAMLVLEALVAGGQPLGKRLEALRDRCGGASHYDRLDLRLPDMDSRRRLEALLGRTATADRGWCCRPGGDHHRWRETATWPKPLADAPFLWNRTAVASVLRGAGCWAGGRSARLGPQLRGGSMSPTLRTLVIASGNRGKIREFEHLLSSLPLRITAQPDGLEVEETGQTFAANARLKAVAVANATESWALADDSGLSVDALNGAPGVHSARYAPTDPERISRLLEALKNHDHRSAHFCAALCLAAPGNGVLLEVQGRCDGQITRSPRGEGDSGMTRSSRWMAPQAPSLRCPRQKRKRTVTGAGPSPCWNRSSAIALQVLRRPG